MHQIVRTRIERNIEYHAAMAEHFEAMQPKPVTPPDATGGPVMAPENPPPMPPAPAPMPAPSNGARVRRASAPTTVEPIVTDAMRLIEMHKGAAHDLRALLDDDPPQAILRSRMRPPITRQVGPHRSSRIH